jgi:ADP-ribose pyrophosphatase YjhB (NUDIX family)
MMSANSLRELRYQGAIIREHHILLIRHQEHGSGRDYWVIPGGGRLEGEAEETCVIREMKEETNLDVRVERLLLDEARFPGRVYRGARTYLCTIVAGEAQPGFEPEPEAAQAYSIVEVGWFDLRDQASWSKKLRSDTITYSLLLTLQSILGYM